MVNVASAGEPHGSAADPQARVLASLLRGARVSLLLGTAPADRGWVASLMPLLCRRAVDRAVITDDAYGPLPAGPERRRRVAAAAPHPDVEIVVPVADWSGAPLAHWRGAIDLALARQGLDATVGDGPLPDALAQLSQQAGLRFLFLFDRFDAYLAAPPEQHEVCDFADAWVSVVNHPDCAVHVMVALDDEADVLMQRFLHGIPTLGEHWLRLGSRDTALPAANDAAAAGITALVDRVSATSRNSASTVGDGAAPLRTADVYESVESMLARVAALNQQVPWRGAATGAVETAAITPPQPPTAAASPRPAPPVSRPVPAPPSAPDPKPGPGGAAIVAGLMLALGALGCAWLLSRSLPSELTAVDVAASAAPRAAPTVSLATLQPRLQIQRDADNAEGERLVQDLSRSVGAGAGLALVGAPTDDWQAAWQPGAQAERVPLLLLRYEALQAAQRLPIPPALQIVTPLFTQELQLRVRADSPLRFIHQIEGRRIDVGPAQGERALTASVLYRRLFAKPLPATAGHAAIGDALRQLRAGQVDVVLWVGGGQVPGAEGTRALALDGRHPASRRALQAFLPARLSVDGAAAVPTLASLLFLVAPAPLTAPQQSLVARLAQAWCQALPVLRRDGDPKWRDFQPGLALDVGWPTVPEAAQAWRDCAASRDAPRSAPAEGNTTRSNPAGA